MAGQLSDFNGAQWTLVPPYPTEQPTPVPTAPSPFTEDDLLSLNYDVFVHIVEALVAVRELGPFSMTCKRIRERCMPFLFRDLLVNVRIPVTSLSLPLGLRPHVRSLTIVDDCADLQVWDFLTRRPTLPFCPDRKLRYTDDPLLCGILNGTVVHAGLSELPFLHTVTIRLDISAVHGLPWHVLEGILTVPQLRHLTTFFVEDAIGRTLANLTAFEYTLDDYRPAPRAYDSEAHALRLILQRVHSTLEVLTLPVECAPLDLLRSLCWPALHELRLRGEPEAPEDPSTPFMHILQNMPALRCLDLRFALPEGTSAQPVWPAGYLPHLGRASQSPWPDLQHLTLSFPSAKDLIYAHLPRTLRSLTLQYFPHLSTHMWQMYKYGVQWHWPGVTAGEMLRILRACCVPELERLEVEYHQDGEEENLLAYIAEAFPKITSLCIRRYRGPGVDEVDVEAIARPLRALAHLRILHLHLDLPGTPAIVYAWRGLDIHPEHERAFGKILNRTADLLAPHLGPSVQLLKLLRSCRYVWYDPWAVYRVLRDSDSDLELYRDGGGGGGSVRVQYDSELSDGIEPSTTVVQRESSSARPPRSPSPKCIPPTVSYDSDSD
ncbi:hypothetical protein OH77DRAFT_1510373 [Trametes cingulata]|nr:hypothetical protein OH77DRAFT_1510373 [Trametes cingulata]